MSTDKFIVICFFLAAFIPPITANWISNVESVNGGVGCATCSILLGLVDKLTIVYNETASESLERFCNFLPGQYKVYCKAAIEFLGPYIVDAFIRGDNPDVICHALKICSDQSGQPKCRIYPSKNGFEERVRTLRRRHPYVEDKLPGIKVCDIPGIKEICKIIDNVFNNEFPLVDFDHDHFGIETTFRGSSWRGKDCNNEAAHIHPGALSVDGDGTVDHNCNGILGMDSATGRPYEQEFCDDSKRLGIAVLGDSISAHFHIPEEWLDASMFSVAAFEHLAFILENELDWPQLSGTTGHLNVSWPNIQGPTRSIYERLFDLDHCNHRDYQNIAVNGARSSSMLHIMKALSRDQKSDAPMLVIYSLVGNDVCNGHPDTIDHMTTPKEMYDNVMETLTYLDTILPSGSHVLTTGLANGSYLYALLHDRLHPFGRVGVPLTYPQMYDYLSCLQISPCNGWLSSNDTLRALTTQRAVDLSAAVQRATNSFQPKNYDMAYLDFPFDLVIQEWVSQGGQPWQLIEPVDGFHINQYGHATVSDVLWQWLQKERPQWLPPLNPHNADIERVFKDQGGY